MKKLHLRLGTFLAVFIAFASNAQDCYYPPSNYTLFTTTDDAYNPPALTGFVTFSETHNGLWTINNATGSVVAELIDDEGRTSTLEISGQGTLTVDAETTDFSVNPNIVSNCSQVFNIQPFFSNITTNPRLAQSCPINLVVVLDESGSIADGAIAQPIRNGVLSLAQILNGTGSTMAIVEFNSLAARVPINASSELQIVDPNFLIGLTDYLNNGYDPTENVVKLIGGTNWEDGLYKANEIANADFILLITDGNPTFYSFNGAMMGSIAGEGDSFDLTALKEAQDVANQIKSAGKHIFVIGVDIPVNIKPITDISGLNSYSFGDGLNAFINADYISVTSDQIQNIFVEIGTITCGDIVPTMSEWGIIVLGLLMIIIGVVFIKTKSISRATALDPI